MVRRPLYTHSNYVALKLTRALANSDLDNAASCSEDTGEMEGFGGMEYFVDCRYGTMYDDEMGLISKALN